MKTMALSEHKYIQYAVIALIVILLVLFGFLIHQYTVLHRASLIGARELEVSTFLHSRGPVTASDVVFIRSWMTFDYINNLFHLPLDYLRDTLTMNDARYPKMSIGSYTNHSHIDLTTFMSELDAAIKNYLANPGT